MLKTSDFAGQDESDIEDVVGRDLYMELVARAYDLSSEHALPASKPDDANDRVVKEVEAHFRTLPPHYDEFNHYRPVETLLGLGESEIADLPGMDQAMDRFEQIFHHLNKLI